jgi:curved DNA-binding protein CbpA
VLSDPKKRKVYDKYGDEGVQHYEAGGECALINSFSPLLTVTLPPSLLSLSFLSFVISQP